MHHLYVVRHGQSVYNAKGIFAGQTDIPLTDLGREQAHIAGQNARNLAIDLIIASPMIRAFETAEIIADEMGYDRKHIIVMPELKERALGSLEGHPFTSIDDEDEHPDAEPMDHLHARIDIVIDYVRACQDKTVLLVAHGSLIRELSQKVVPGKFPNELPNATIVELL